jgi:hypothetical protein
MDCKRITLSEPEQHLKRMVKQWRKDPQLELEARIHYSTPPTLDWCNTLVKRLQDTDLLTPKPKQRFMTFEYPNDTRLRFYIEDGRREWYSIKKISHVDVQVKDQPYMVRFGLKSEEKLDTVLPLIPSHWIRAQNRYTFLYPNENQPMCEYSITHIQQGATKETASTSPFTFEIEIELLHTNHWDDFTVEEIVKEFYLNAMDLSGPDYHPGMPSSLFTKGTKRKSIKD